MSYFDRIRACNDCRIDDLLPFHIAGERYGFLTGEFAEKLKAWPALFEFTPAGVQLSDRLETPDQRTRALAEVTRRLAAQGVIKSWNNELFDIKNDFSAEPVMRLERAAVIHFGMRAYGVHVNGLVETDAGWQLWVATRARDKPTFPGMLDHIVAGGQPAGLGLLENVIKEADEEASIPAELASRAEQVGRITYCSRTERGLKPDTLFCFDLRLPVDFTPRSNDGEVESFELMPLETVAGIVRDTTRFKPNCNLVIIDLLIRLGLIRDDHEALQRALHPVLP